MIIRNSLRNLLSIPQLFVKELKESLLSAIQTPSSTSSDNSFHAVDTFPVRELLHPSITELNMETIPPILRNLVIHNVAKMPRLRVLTLCVAMTMPWSAFFSDIQTGRFCRGISSLQVLVFQDYADDSFLAHVGEHCHQLSRLDVQGSVCVTDTGLSKLQHLFKLQYLDVNRTEISAAALQCFLEKMPHIVSLGTWDDYSNLLEEPCLKLTDIRTSSLTQSQIQRMCFLCQDLVSLEIKITNNSYKLQCLSNLISLTSLSMSGVNYKQSRLVVAMLALSLKLQSLYLEHVNGLDTGDLRTIGQDCTALGMLSPPLLCPVKTTLECLTLSNCTVTSSTQDPPQYTARTKLFHSLRTLVISSNISPSQVGSVCACIIFSPLVPGADRPCLQSSESSHRHLLLGLHQAPLSPTQAQHLAAAAHTQVGSRDRETEEINI